MTRKHFLALKKLFIAQYDLDLQNAFIFLGGSGAVMRLHLPWRVLSAQNPKFDRLERELNWLCESLSLENVDDIESEEPDRFAAMDLDDDAVWSVCAMTKVAADLLYSFYEISDARHRTSWRFAARNLLANGVGRNWI